MATYKKDQKNPEIIIPWDQIQGTVLEPIPSDLQQIIGVYWLTFQSQREKPTLKKRYKYSFSFGDGSDGLKDPSSVAIDHSNNVFVTCTGDNIVRVHSPDGRYLYEFGEEGERPSAAIAFDREGIKPLVLPFPDDGPLLRVEFLLALPILGASPCLFSSGNLVTIRNQKIQVLDRDWTIKFEFPITLKDPFGLMVSPINGDFVVFKFQTVHVYSSTGLFIRELICPSRMIYDYSRSMPERHITPNLVSVDTDPAGNYIVADAANHVLIVFDRVTGTPLPKREIHCPSKDYIWHFLRVECDPPVECRAGGMCVDRIGKIVVTDAANNRVLIFAHERGHEVIQELAKTEVTNESLHSHSKGCGPGRFHKPQGVAINHDGNLYIVDQKNNRVQVWVEDLEPS